ncbi:MAG: AsmA family protein [Rhodothalassiaceae bacterium]
MLEAGGKESGTGGRVRRALVAAGAALVLLVAAALVVPGFIDWTGYRDRIAGLAEGLTGREVRIGGPVSFRLLPSPALSAGAVTIANIPGGKAEALVRVERLDVVVGLLPLLRGKIRVRRIDLVGPEIALERDADGSDNWHLAFMTTRTETSGAPSGQLSIESLRIRHGRLAFRDAVTGRDMVLADIDARLAAPSLRGPFDAGVSASLNGVVLAAQLRSGTFTPDTRVPLDVRIEVEGSSLRYRGWLRLREDAAPEGKGQLDGAAADLGAFMAAVSRLDGSSLAPPAPLARRFALSGDLLIGADLRLEDIKGRVGDTALAGRAALDLGDGPHLALTLRADRLDLDPVVAARSGEGATPLRFADGADTLLPPALRLDLDLAIEALAYRGEIISRTRFRATGRGGVLGVDAFDAALPGAGSWHAEGRIFAEAGVPRATGRATLRIGDLRRAAAWLGHELTGREGSFSHAALETGFDWRPDRLVLEEARIVVDSTTASGALRWEDGAGRPSLAVDLRLDRLNLDGYLPPPGPDSVPRQEVSLAARINGFLKAMPVTLAPLRLRIDRLVYDQAAMRDVALDLRSEGSALSIAAAHVGELEGASADISGILSPQEGGPRMALHVRAEIADLARLAGWRGMTLPPLLEGLGPLRVEGDLSGLAPQMEIDLEAGLLGGRLAAKGPLRWPPEAAESGPQATLDVVADFADPHALLDHLGWAALMPGNTGPLRLGAHIDRDADTLSGRAEGQLLGGRITLAGKLTSLAEAPQGSFDLHYAHPDVAAFLQVFDPAYGPAAENPGGLELAGQVSLARKDMTLALTHLKAGPAALSGTIVYTPGDPRPRLVATLRGEDLPLRQLLPPPENGAIAARRSVDRRWSREPWPLETLRSHDAAVTLVARRLAFGPYDFRAPRLRLSLENGLMRLEEFRAGLFGGEVTASGNLDARAVPSLSAALDLTGGELADLLQSFAGLDFASGTSDVSVRFTATGESPAAMAATLDGRASLSARDGVLHGIDLAALSQRLGSLRQPGGIAALFRTTLAGGETPFSRLSATAVARGGVIESDDIRLVHAAGDFTGRLTLSLPDWRVRGDGLFRFADHADAPPIGFVVAGSLARPHVELATDALGQWLMRQILARAYQPIAPSRDALGVPDIVGEDAAAGEKGKTPPQPAFEDVPGAILDRFLGFMRDKAKPARKPDDPGR